MKYLEYMNEHPTENLGWCKPYTDKNENKYLVIYDGEVSGIKTETAEVTTLDGRWELEKALGELARKVTKDYDLYSGYSDKELALIAMHEVGCADCPWKYDCDAMGEYINDEEEEE